MAQKKERTLWQLTSKLIIIATYPIYMGSTFRVLLFHYILSKSIPSIRPQSIYHFSSLPTKLLKLLFSFLLLLLTSLTGAVYGLQLTIGQCPCLRGSMKSQLNCANDLFLLKISSSRRVKIF